MLNIFKPNDAQRRHREVTFVEKMVDSSVTQSRHGILQRMTENISRLPGPWGGEENREDLLPVFCLFFPTTDPSLIPR